MSAPLSGCIAVLGRAFAMGGRVVVSLALVPNCTEAAFAKDKCAAGQVQSGASVSSQSGATVGGLALHAKFGSLAWTSDCLWEWC